MVSDTAVIYREIPRRAAELLAGLRGLGVADVYDALPPAARETCLMDGFIPPVTHGLKAHGQAITAFCPQGDSLMSHCALYLARPGDVIVISNGGVSRGAVWGAAMTHDATVTGIAGAIIDAPVRDVALTREMQFPLWARAVSAAPGEKSGEGYVNMPVSCGGRTVNPGDIVIADDDGVLVFSPDHIEAVLQTTSRILQRQADLRHRIARGERLFETQNFAQLLGAKQIEIRAECWRDGSA